MQGALTDWWTLPTDKLGEFIEWQDEQYLPAVVAARLGRTVCRYRPLSGGHTQVSWIDVQEHTLASQGSGIDNTLPPLPIWLKLLNGQARERFILQLKADVGDQSSSPAPFRYVVQADIPTELADEYNAWYDQEHLPRLVSVPGIRRARRYIAPDNSPRYLTSYDLDAVDIFNTPAALEARKTPWTEKMRSAFLNSRRTMLILEHLI